MVSLSIAMEGSESIEKAAAYYGILFAFPSHVTIIAYLSAVSVLSGIFSFAISFGSRYYLKGALLGLTALFLPSIIGDLIVSGLIIPGHVILNSRRISALSLFTITLWGIVLILASTAGRLLGIVLLERAFVFGFSLALSIRAICLRILSLVRLTKSSILREGASTIIPPSFCLLSASLWINLSPGLIAIGLLSTILMVITTILSLHVLDKSGLQRGFRKPTSLFRAFASVWMENDPDPLEGILEKDGVESEVPIKILGFAGDKPRALVIAPSIHYGPFRSAGSSSFPSIAIDVIGEELGCPIFPIHTLVGHEKDVTSRAQCDRLVQKIIEMAAAMETHDGASPFVRTLSGSSSASCQIFGKCAVITLTMAPKTTEDLPPWVEDRIIKRANEKGIHAIAIDAHNSLEEGQVLSQGDMEGLQKAAIDALEKAYRKGRYPVWIGASHVDSRFGVERGMGGGGINVLVVRTQNQTAAYILLDCNNMISGLRERINRSIKELGIDECETLTSDTHTVNAMGKSKRGYPLLGEKITPDEIIEEIVTATKQALKDTEESRVLWAMGTLKVKVVGEELLQQLCGAVDWGVRFERKLLWFLYLPTIIFSFLLVLFAPIV